MKLLQRLRLAASRIEVLASTTTGLWAGGFLAAGAVLLFCFWIPENYVPHPGYSIAVLAALSVVISLHHEKPKALHKALYLELAILLLVGEIRAMRLDYTQQTASRKSENDRFKEIVDGIKGASAESQKQFNATAARFERMSSMITGGDGFCYMDFGQPPMGRIEDLLLFVNHDRYPLYSVIATVYDANTGGHTGEHSNKDIDVGDIPPKGITRRPALDLSPDDGDFSIVFSARNGVWIEQLRYKKVGILRRRALKVSRSGSKQILFELIDKDFPRDAAGNVNWY